MEFRIINSPSQAAMEMLTRRKGSGSSTVLPPVGAVGLVQGKVIDMVVAADIAEKSVGVVVEDIKGTCPQNMVAIALFGDTAAVTAAMAAIKTKLQDGSYAC